MPLPFRPAPPSQPAPDAPFVAIGDVHGRLDLLAPLLRRIVRRDPDLPIVVLGDMIDRGPDSAGVLRLLHHWRHDRVICLPGNHEDMMLGFIDAPREAAGPWLRHGGRETLASFGLSAPDTADPAALGQTAARLARALGPLHGWLRDLRPIWRNGNVVAAHAGMNPALPPERQPRHDLLWGHGAFAATPRRDGLWVVHGHVVHDAPFARDGRIAIDTGAWETGRLTAARIGADKVEFIREGGAARPQPLMRTGTPL